VIALAVLNHSKYYKQAQFYNTIYAIAAFSNHLDTQICIMQKLFGHVGQTFVASIMNHNL